MSDQEEEELMSKYGITAEARIIYRYDGHTYHKLDDAIRYAQAQTHEDDPANPTAPSR